MIRISRGSSIGKLFSYRQNNRWFFIQLFFFLLYYTLPDEILYFLQRVQKKQMFQKRTRISVQLIRLYEVMKSWADLMNSSLPENQRGVKDIRRPCLFIFSTLRGTGCQKQKPKAGEQLTTCATHRTVFQRDFRARLSQQTRLPQLAVCNPFLLPCLCYGPTAQGR